jgi:uncharacterized protein
MKKSMLDILACPIDKHYPLELFEINIKKYNYNNNNHNNSDIVISEGILFCTKCSRYYPIIEEIPVMLPDELREKQTDIDFLRKWSDKIPEKVIKCGNPWHLSDIKNYKIEK